MNKSKMYFFIAMLSTLFLLGCTAVPQYDTFHSYVPPKGAEAKSCLFQCTMTESQCEQISQMRLDNCTMRSQNKFDACQVREQRTYDNCVNAGGSGCYVAWCQQAECSTASNCKTKFNGCYSICGGVVTSETRCVANCEQPK